MLTGPAPYLRVICMHTAAMQKSPDAQPGKHSKGNPSIWQA